MACIVQSKANFTKYTRDNVHLFHPPYGFAKEDHLQPILVELAQQHAASGNKNPAILVDVGAASVLGGGKTDQSEVVFFGKALQQAGVNFMFYGFEPGHNPYLR